MKRLLYNPLLGLPLLYIGVLLMALHFVFHLNANWLLVVSLCLEVAGVVLHYYKIKHPYDRK